MNVQEKVPCCRRSLTYCTSEDWVAPLNLREEIPVLGVNPVPLTVTVIPVGPWDGVRVMVGVVIVKVAVAVSDPPSLPVATTA